jgi:hypothetical protein
VIQKAFKELKSDKILHTLEYCLAVGNYLNNPKQQCLGFRFGALLKLADVKTRDSKITLLHMLARIIQENEPDLLTFVNELEALKTAPEGVIE